MIMQPMEFIRKHRIGLGVGSIGWVVTMPYFIYEYFEYGVDAWTHFSNMEHLLIIAWIPILMLAGYLYDRKLLGERLVASEEEYRTLVETAPDGIISVDGEGNFVFANEQFCRMVGYSRDELLRKNWAEMLPTEERKEGMELFKLALREGLPLHIYEGKVRRKDGSLFDARVRWGCLHAGGKVVGGLGVVRDITERKRAEEEIRRLKDFSESVINGISDAISVIDVNDYRVVSVNKAFLDILGLSREEVIGKTCYEITHDKTSPCMPPSDPCPIEELLETGKPVRMEHVHLDKDKRERFVEVSAHPIYEEGAIKKVVHITRDITERKRAEERIRELSQFPEKNPNPILKIGRDGEILYYNPGVFNYVDDAEKVEELLPANYRELISVACESGEEVRVEHRYKDNYIDYVIWPVSKNAAHVYGRDVTERKKAEAELRRYARELERSNRLKELFTDIMRHDLLNLVTVIKGVSQMLRQESSGNVKRGLERIWKSVLKLEEMIESAARLSKLDDEEELSLVEKDLNSVFKEVVDNFRPMLEEKRMRVEYLPKGKRIARVYPIIEDVFANLLSNAVKYSPPKSKVTIDILDEGDAWKVMVADQGEGVPDEYKETIFDRFKRGGKAGVKGTGLGLAIVKRVVELHRGKVWVEDNPGGGSIFYVVIPKNGKAGD
jgi:PAS domain S-box-containing protein